MCETAKLPKKTRKHAGSLERFVFIRIFTRTSNSDRHTIMKDMQWFNEPEVWAVDQHTLTMFVTPQTDYWRVTHYGFTVDDGPFYYTTCGGEFEVKVKVSGDYQSRFDQVGLMLRIDEQTWIKTGVEYIHEKINLSAVVTINQSDWSVITLDDKPLGIWFKAIRRQDAVEISYSFDDSRYTMMRLAFFPDDRPVMVGLTGASPDGEGFNAQFEAFEVKHLPDTRRSAWLRANG